MGWLVMKRKMGETLNIGESIVVVNRIRGNEVSLGVLAPEYVKILRGELVGDEAVQKDADCGMEGKVS